MNAQDKRRNTPLHFACGRSNVEIVKLLLLHDANEALQNCARQTPRDIVRRGFLYNKNAKKAILRMLAPAPGR